MPKYWENFFLHTGVSPKWVKSKRRREKKERLNDGNNNGQAMAHASTHGACKPPGPIK